MNQNATSYSPREGDVIAILSPQFITLKTHYLKTQKKTVRCLAPDRCAPCEDNLKMGEKTGGFIWDYQDQRNPIKFYSTASAGLKKFWYARFTQGGLNSCDYRVAMKQSTHGNFKAAFFNPMNGLQISSNPGAVMSLWPNFQGMDIGLLLASFLPYDAQRQLLLQQPANNYQNNNQNYNNQNSNQNQNSQPQNNNTGFWNNSSQQQQPQNQNNQNQNNQNNNYNQNQGNNYHNQNHNQSSHSNNQSPPPNNRGYTPPPPGDIDDIT